MTDKRKIIFAKATVDNFCAIVICANKGELQVCDIAESGNIRQFLDDVAELARKHRPEILQYECSVYLHECRELREKLNGEDIRTRGYRSEGSYLDRIVSQADYIEENVIIDNEFTRFIDMMLSFSPSGDSKDNIALDILSDATKFLRKYHLD